MLLSSAFSFKWFKFACCLQVENKHIYLQNESSKVAYYFQIASRKIKFMKSIEKRSDCPISSSLDIFGDKWSLLIVRDLMVHETRTYGDFTKSAEKIATNILANRLQVLEENGIIVKLPFPDNKVKGLY